ncbi:DJ-1/PfpI family protein [Aurantivibrio infirmus]
MIKVSILTFDGFNEIDSFLALNAINRMVSEGIEAEITSPTPSVVSMNGVRIDSQRTLEFALEADVVIVGSGRNSEKVANDKSIIDELQIDLNRQIVCSQCSGALILAKMGLLDDNEISTDNSTRTKLIDSGYRVGKSGFTRYGNVVTVGGCLSAHYLAGWVICQFLGKAAMEQALSYIVPVGEEEQYISRVYRVISPYIHENNTLTNHSKPTPKSGAV